MADRKEKMVAHTDLPCMGIEEDKLNARQYIDGLSNFIRECATPMSIAIQGDWGTGKTSTLNMITNEINKKNEEAGKDCLECKTVEINTWQYSQFNMADDLCTSFVTVLLQKLGFNDKANALFKSLKNMLAKQASKTVSALTKGIVDIDEFFENIQRSNTAIQEFKKIFGETIRKTGKRVVIFVDDLDRLEPKLAVELLEIIKLFMDVENCVFVLAIDYDVVVTGVKSKYGSNIPNEKCRSFFDKIIQLPFNLPVEKYDFRYFIEEIAGEKIKDERYIAILSKLIGSLINWNPRSFKRLSNSYSLIGYINAALGEKKANDNLYNTLILAVLCVQMKNPKLYKVIENAIRNESEDDKSEGIDLFEIDEYDNFVKYIKDLSVKFADDEKSVVFDYFSIFKDFCEEIKKANGSDITNTLKDAFAATAVTSTGTEEKKEVKVREEAVPVNRVIINGSEHRVKNATQAYVYVFEELGKIDSSVFGDFYKLCMTAPKGYASIFKEDSPSREQLKIGETTYWLNKKLGFEPKLSNLSKLIAFYNKESGKTYDIKLKFNDEQVFPKES